jgi:hypothetical protein
MSAYKIQTPGNYPEESIQRTEHGESLKSRMPIIFCQINLKAPRTTLSETHAENNLLLTLKKYISSATLQEAGEIRFHTDHRYGHDQFKMFVAS